MFVWGVATTLCRPDLKAATWLVGVYFGGYCWVFIKGLEWLRPGHIESVWNLGALASVLVHAVPIGRVLFTAGFGCNWAGIYGHHSWQRPVGTPVSQ
jgi:hypothetical protein